MKTFKLPSLCVMTLVPTRPFSPARSASRWSRRSFGGWFWGQLHRQYPAVQARDLLRVGIHLADHRRQLRVHAAAGLVEPRVERVEARCERSARGQQRLARGNRSGVCRDVVQGAEEILDRGRQPGVGVREEVVDLGNLRVVGRVVARLCP
jgi:hypothetical protein